MCDAGNEVIVAENVRRAPDQLGQEYLDGIPDDIGLNACAVFVVCTARTVSDVRHERSIQLTSRAALREGRPQQRR